ncbi:hypothetical protein BofuT4_uP066690.1 [Botrytis cinerea T4]|uniref:Uncharacterized protein n=1 Tax=Botryotinia fuckeliana (strain T4) TaxID=999810 RepID=G2XR93_BOTF4|nr:hypothetical protein BofuT4_uP066690.1 [Botrytis cinerea T4]
MRRTEFVRLKAGRETGNINQSSKQATQISRKSPKDIDCAAQEKHVTRTHVGSQA